MGVKTLRHLDPGVPAEYGGTGLDIFSYVLALEEICYADARAFAEPNRMVALEL